jgi:hypothetical protein
LKESIEYIWKTSAVLRDVMDGLHGGLGEWVEV